MMLKNPLAYKEIVDLCNECVGRGLDKEPNLPRMTAFKIMGVPETITFLAKLPEVYDSKAEFSVLTKQLFKRVMIRTRYPPHLIALDSMRGNSTSG